LKQGHIGILEYIFNRYLLGFNFQNKKGPARPDLFLPFVAEPNRIIAEPNRIIAVDHCHNTSVNRDNVVVTYVVAHIVNVDLTVCRWIENKHGFWLRLEDLLDAFAV
jgi:hypothetical protein